MGTKTKHINQGDRGEDPNINPHSGNTYLTFDKKMTKIYIGEIQPFQQKTLKKIEHPQIEQKLLIISHIVKKKKKMKPTPGEVAQQLTALAALPGGKEFQSQGRISNS